MNVILEGIVGSTAYGLANPNKSDVDYLGIYLAPRRDVLGLNGGTTVEKSYVTQNPDRTLHEIGKFCRLALKCNPTIIDLLFLPEYTIDLFEGRRLLAIRSAFLSTSYVRQYFIGYAMHQANRLVNRTAAGIHNFDSDTGNRVAKHGRHCWRLTLVAEHLLTTGEVLVDVSDYRERIFEAGVAAEEDPEAYAALIRERATAIENAKSVLPNRPDRELVDNTLVRIRMENR